LFPFDAAVAALPRKRFTRDEVTRLREAGFFEGQRYELIDGDLFDKRGQNPPPAVNRTGTFVLLASSIAFAFG
jgi:hypothetical protein